MATSRHVGEVGRIPSECARKAAFGTHGAAQHNAKRLAHNTGDVVHTYYCAVCGQWHVGGFKTQNRKVDLLKRPRQPEPPDVDAELEFYDIELPRARAC
jgi:hypothetical protein